MRTPLLILGAVLGLGLGAHLAWAAPTPPAVTLDTRPLGVAVHKTVLPAHRVNPEDPLDWGHAAAVHLALGPQDPARQEAALSVYPVAGLVAANPGDLGREVQTQLGRLRTLLKSWPARPSGELPYLLGPPADQVFATAVRYLDFPGGSGVRYLTMYSSDVSPVTSDRLFYTFQGLTEDGKYILVLTYPVSTRRLPANYDAVPPGQRDALARGVGYPAYLSRTAQMLGATGPADFSPSLGKLDAAVRGIRVGP
ncbi:hypothetical protein [Deinococcus apachensis]|uniref:hypothetical protein n=1 Tax=Deinococcus apachensis TaxID=309886 RepID=UPI00039CB59D|nr:hypothetical protein [Deinococcus apachensis]